MKAFSARCRAKINDIISRFRICCFRYHHRTDILHHEPSHHKRFKSFEVAVIRQIVRIRKIRRPLNRRSLSLQTVDRQLRIYPVQLAADRQRMIRQKILQHTFRRLCSISLHPAFYQPLRYGIVHRQIFCRAGLCIRICDFFFFSCHITHHAVDKAFQAVKSFFLCQFYRFVAGCRVRHAVHK